MFSSETTACYNFIMQEDKDDKSPVTLIGVPLDLGAESLGVDIGPDALRQKKLVEKLTDAGLTIHDAGNIPCPDRKDLEVGDPLLPYGREIAHVNEVLATQTKETMKRGERVVVIGGDHSINLGAFSGAAAALGSDVGMIYLDAHGDINTPESSLSHNVHGMHLAALMGFGPPEFVNVHTAGVKLAKNNLLHIGGSDLDPAEWELVKRENLRCFTLLDLLKHGLAPLITMIDELAARLPNLWVSLDLDVIDNVYAPGVGLPNHGGLAYREIAAITEYIGQHCHVVGLDLAEYNPLKDDAAAQTADLAIEIIAKLLGTNYSWYTTYMARQH